VAVLERKLHHLRSWMGSVNAQMAATNPQLVKNARRLYVGGVPPGTTEVRGAARTKAGRLRSVGNRTAAHLLMQGAGQAGAAGTLARAATARQRPSTRRRHCHTAPPPATGTPGQLGP
jgi:hypothetical protein